MTQFPCGISTRHNCLSNQPLAPNYQIVKRTSHRSCLYPYIFSSPEYRCSRVSAKYIVNLTKRVCMGANITKVAYKTSIMILQLHLLPHEKHSVKQVQFSATKNACRGCIYITGFGGLIIVKQFDFRLPSLLSSWNSSKYSIYMHPLMSVISINLQTTCHFVYTAHKYIHCWLLRWIYLLVSHSDYSMPLFAAL